MCALEMRYNSGSDACQLRCAFLLLSETTAVALLCEMYSIQGTSPHLASPRLASPRLAHLASPHLTSPHLTCCLCVYIM